MALFVACLRSNNADGGYIEHWLGSNSINPYKFNNHKQQLVAHEKVLEPGDVFLIIKVDFDLKRKVNCHIPPTGFYQKLWQALGCFRKGNHSWVYFLELKAPFVVDKALTVSLLACEIIAVTTEDPQQHKVRADLNTDSVT